MRTKNQVKFDLTFKLDQIASFSWDCLLFTINLVGIFADSEACQFKIPLGLKYIIV